MPKATTEELASLAPGDVVELTSLMAGLSPTPVQLRVLNAKMDPLIVDFHITWEGVTLGQCSVSLKDDKQKWSFR